MPKIILSNLQTPLLNPMSLLTDTVPEAWRIQFYYSNANDIICASRSVTGTITISSPHISEIKYSDLEKIGRDVGEELDRQMTARGIKDGQDVIFDTKTGQILDRDSFADFPPIDGENCLFILENEKDEWNGVIHYLNDRSKPHALAALSLFVAKMRLNRPTGKEWREESKLLLTYLLATQTGKSHKFETLKGPWTNMTFDFSKNAPQKKNLDLTKVKLEKLIKLSQKIKLERTKRLKLLTSGEQTKGPNDNPFVRDQEVEDMFKQTEQSHPFFAGSNFNPAEDGIVMLTDVVNKGAAHFFPKGYLPVYIDTAGDTYKEISIDGKGRLVMVVLQPGVKISEEYMRDSLGAEEIVVLDRIGDLEKL